ncbi:MAG: hypothetical protein K6B54_03805 [Clostridia bacterium]|nr:hypothetical protein [Clostridia bacterium]MCR5056016.1 hypothetical protein [Clostridia bacterium]
MKKTVKIISAAVLIILCLGLVACGTLPGSPEEAVKKMKNKGYEAEYDGSGVTAIRIDGDGQPADMIFAMMTESESQAKQVYPYLKQMYETQMSSMEQVGFKVKTGYEGKWVYFGTQNAIEAFKR